MRAESPDRKKLNFYQAPPHACSYLPERSAAIIFADPRQRKDPRMYSHLCRQGFRRSGELLYRPHCADCQACVSVRVAAHDFTPSRGQRRIWQKNQSLRVSAAAPVYRDEHFDLYQRYIAGRHAGGSMDDADPADYMQFLTARWSDTVFYEFRLEQRLLGVAVADRLQDGLSAVYTFFEPGLPQLSLGVYAVLWEIRECVRQGLDYLYLGYWIENCRKMSYKNQYRPLQGFIAGEWRDLAR